MWPSPRTGGASPGPAVHGWRGRSVLLGSNEEIRTAGLIPELSVAFTPESLYDEAEAQALVPPASLALRWPEELPTLVLDAPPTSCTTPTASHR